MVRHLWSLDWYDCGRSHTNDSIDFTKFQSNGLIILANIGTKFCQSSHECKLKSIQRFMVIVHTVRRHCIFYSIKLPSGIRKSLHWIVSTSTLITATMNGNQKKENISIT